MKKILIADDDINVHKLLAEALSPDEFKISHAYDGLETLKCIAEERPDLVVLDIMMPDKDGRDICRDLRNDPRTKKIKILILSGKDEQFDRILGLELGADDYVTKPCSPILLVSGIKRMLEK